MKLIVKDKNYNIRIKNKIQNNIKLLILKKKNKI